MIQSFPAPLLHFTFYYLCPVSKKVVIGLSGGVDSSVAAWLLVRQGYDVCGLFMRNWHDNTGLLQSDCHWEDDLMFAEMAAKKIGIPFHVVDLSTEYRKKVIDYMFAEYERGRTPNPDILCNREIKFDSFAIRAKEMGADYVATGHYCRKATVRHNGVEIFRLLGGKDGNKDQSYFLCQLTQEQLAFSLFPVGGMTKQEVRKLAEELKLPTARRKDSQGICFVGKIDLPAFLQQKLKAREGDIIEVRSMERGHSGLEVADDESLSDDRLKQAAEPHNFRTSSGFLIGKHKGAHFFTVGQRKGLNIGGYKEPLFVLATDTEENIIYVGESRSHTGLYRKGLFIKDEDIHWIRTDLEMNNNEDRNYMVRVRYRQPLQKARLYKRKEGIYVIFHKLQRGITPGQFAAWYDGEELQGSGVIDR